MDIVQFRGLIRGMALDQLSAMLSFVDFPVAIFDHHRPECKKRMEGGHKRSSGDRGRPPLGVIIVTYNSAEVVGGLLDSLSAGLAGVDHEVIVVDNASADESVAISRSHPACAGVIETGFNSGYAAGINAAAATLAPDADILVLNPDIRLQHGTARQLLDALRDEKVGIAVPRLLDEDGHLALSIRREPSIGTVWSDALLGAKLAGRLGFGEIVHDNRLYSAGGSVDWATGAILMISGRARARIGTWDETFFLYSEEVDYLERARSAGFRVSYVANAVARHIGGEYHGNPRLSALMTANRIRYFRRHHGAIATSFYRAAILIGESLRSPLGAGHRAAASAALRMPDPKKLAFGTA